MEPDREYRAAAPLGLRDAWRRHSPAGGWLAPDDWDSQAVDAVLAACQPGWPADGAVWPRLMGRSGRG